MIELFTLYVLERSGKQNWKCPCCLKPAVCVLCEPIARIQVNEAFFKCRFCKPEYHQHHWPVNVAIKSCFFCDLPLQHIFQAVGIKYKYNLLVFPSFHKMVIIFSLSFDNRWFSLKIY